MRRAPVPSRETASLRPRRRERRRRLRRRSRRRDGRGLRPRRAGAADSKAMSYRIRRPPLRHQDSMDCRGVRLRRNAGASGRLAASGARRRRASRSRTRAIVGHGEGAGEVGKVVDPHGQLAAQQPFRHVGARLSARRHDTGRAQRDPGQHGLGQAVGRNRRGLEQGGELAPGPRLVGSPRGGATEGSGGTAKRSTTTPGAGRPASTCSSRVAQRGAHGRRGEPGRFLGRRGRLLVNRRGLGYERAIGDEAEREEGQGEDRRRQVSEARHRAIMPGSRARHVTRLSAALANEGKGEAAPIPAGRRPWVRAARSSRRSRWRRRRSPRAPPPRRA